MHKKHRTGVNVGNYCLNGLWIKTLSGGDASSLRWNIKMLIKLGDFCVCPAILELKGGVELEKLRIFKYVEQSYGWENIVVIKQWVFPFELRNLEPHLDCKVILLSRLNYP